MTSPFSSSRSKGLKMDDDVKYAIICMAMFIGGATFLVWAFWS